MRMRKKKHGAERINNCAELLIQNPAQPFDNDRPVRLEIGCGKGRFILETARRNPEINFIAMEKISDVALLAMEGVKREGLTNVRFLIADAKSLSELLPVHSVEMIYLNFNDPWPKKGHTKRRLTYKDFLELYRRVLTEDGSICLKTDNRPYFDFSLEQLAENGFRLEEVTNDLHSSEWGAGNVHTEYEDNFSAKGFTINRCRAYVR